MNKLERTRTFLLGMIAALGLIYLLGGSGSTAQISERNEIGRYQIALAAPDAAAGEADNAWLTVLDTKTGRWETWSRIENWNEFHRGTFKGK